MTTTALKKKIQKYIDTTDDVMLQAVYTILEEHSRAKKESSALSASQKTELDRRMKLYESGKMEVYDWKDVYKELKAGKKS